jgi:hypothetical protein
MVELYRAVESAWSDEIEGALKEMVIAHRVITVHEGQKLPASLNELPALCYEGQCYTGQAIIKRQLAELAHFITVWGKYQSDSCYIDEDGKSC